MMYETGGSRFRLFKLRFEYWIGIIQVISFFNFFFFINYNLKLELVGCVCVIIIKSYINACWCC